jgi:aspartate racemase
MESETGGRALLLAIVVLLATRYTMEQDFYTGRLRNRHGIDVVVPAAEERALVHRVIYDELCRGEIRAESKAAYLEIIESHRSRGADGVILGCTEVGLLVGANDVELPVFDTTRIHVDRALAFALEA